MLGGARREDSPQCLLDPLFQSHGDSVPRALADGLADFGFYGQHVISTAHCHERTGERMAINCALDLDEAARAKELDRLGPRHVGPPTLPRTFLELGRECSIQHVGKYYRCVSWMS